MTDTFSTPEVDEFIRARAADDEFARQRALDRYRVVDSLPEDAYDDIVRVAAAVCGTPVALVSLIDRDRQWFKAKIGLDDSQTPRNVAVCDTAIRNPEEIMEVRDLTQDVRFADFPSVSGEFGARFYAGAPLVTPEGAAIGTVCVVDTQPRTLTEAQRTALEALGRLTISLLEGRGRERELERDVMLQPLETARVEAVQEEAPDLGYSVVILELQDHAGLVERLGDRAVEKTLQQVDQALEQAIDRARGDAVNRVTGSGEFIAVLQGDESGETLQRLQAIAQGHAAQGYHLLVGSATASSSREATQHVFMRADESLSHAKDAHHHAG